MKQTFSGILRRSDAAFPVRKALLLCLPFAVLCVYFIFWHTNGNLTGGDDSIFATSLGWLSLPEWLATRWNTWTSRLLLEIPLVLIARSPHALLWWGGISTVCLLVIAACLTRLCGGFTLQGAVLSCLFTGLIWSTTAFDSGMLTMSAVYLWPLAAALLCLLPLTAAHAPRWYVWLLCLPCLVYAADQEQLCTALLLLFGGAAALRLLQRKACSCSALAYPLCGAFVCLCMLAVHLLCPGNAARRIANYAWFADYDMLTFPQKLELGASGTVSGMLLTPSVAWGAFYLILAVVCAVRCRGVFARALGCAPAVLWLALGVLPSYVPQPLRTVLTIGTRLTQHGSIYLENHNVPTAYLFPALMLSFAFLLLAAVYVALGHTPRALIAVWVLLVGFAARMTLIFSPSVWVSGTRTHLVLQFCCVAVCLLLVSSLPSRPFWRGRKSGIASNAPKAKTAAADAAKHAL